MEPSPKYCLFLASFAVLACLAFSFPDFSASQLADLETEVESPYSFDLTEEEEELEDISDRIGLRHVRSPDDQEAPRRRRLVKKRRRPAAAVAVGAGNVTESVAPPEGASVRKVLRKKSSHEVVRDLTEENKQKERDARFFSLFTVVRFDNSACSTTSGENGTCYTANDCTLRGGTSSGTCASGFGVCCYFEFSCGRHTSDNGTYFVNPASPQRICNLMVTRRSDDICQIRLDFVTFDLSEPNLRGECTTDFFLVTGGSPVPQLCGANSGQHIIYSITSNSGPTQLSVILDTTQTASASRQWKIRIFQYECSSRLLAPVGCLQYFYEASGQIKSFNYKSEVRVNSEPNHLANLNYAICIRVDNGYCGIRYSQVSTDPYSFTLSGDATAVQMFPLPTANVKYGDVDCQNDYIIIPGGSEDGRNNIFARDRFCGRALGRCTAGATAATTCMPAVGAVTSFSKPFVVQVVTDLDEGNPVIDKANRGFLLNYNQQPCLLGR